MGWYCLVLVGTDSLWIGTIMVLGQFNLVMLGIRWYNVSIRLLCLHILKKMEI